MQTILPVEPVICHNLINGEWVKGEGGQPDVFSPYNGKKIGEVSLPSPNQIEIALQAAAEAQVSWGKTPIKERSQILFNFRNILLRDLDQISHLKSSECGKTFAEARAGLMKGIEVLEFALSLQNLDLGGKLEVSRGVTCEYRREPLGVIANITPFNFPAMVPMWTIPICLALGNAYVWKPSDKTPLTALRIANALLEAGLPKGVFTVLHGGAFTVDAIIDHPAVKAIGFVGSTKVAKIVYQRGTQLGKRVLALGGAKNHIVLLPDANAELSGIGISDSFTGCAGQRCMAASVLLAVGDVDRHIQKVIARASSMELGKDMGALITKSQKDFLVDAIDKAEKAGAKILLDGRKAKAPAGMEDGNWIGPTILDDIQVGSEAATVELFGPILSIVRCKDISEAMKIENSVEYGNACSVFTSSGPLADRVVREASTGMVGVNIGVPVPREPFSFGGINASKFGHGDITGHHSLDFWSNVKKITTKWETQADSNWMS
ncbi:CoA-acylating methylmalonate-semialdehyde dehydrogenase [Pseudobdellovibrio exovorus]|uniref:Methylmalonate-semialdehyde dehydrogenase n=1 Tax=Pseudobdellovibrio exovorus JSS TaxID=1184267 RepID=M4V9V1_9BACT|nr:CoA-acylating methylmalonate-semialdehyde dehydrogenase [Pseudobdellovibrio exovorus]AGH95968.1 methylmalonate-semialdehyde dehydrogenase [Pseudobdellovibrio exovorus JSS]